MTQATVPVYRLEMVRERSVHYASARCQTASDAATVLHSLLDHADRERIYVIALNVRKTVIGVHEAASGGLNACSLRPRDVLKFALLSNADAIILGHNHPSGDPLPSMEDIDLTRVLATAATTVGVTLVDHVIVAPEGAYHSMHDHNEAGLGEGRREIG